MIRRDFMLADGSAGWALISQIEHARVHAQLAARCTGRFGAGNVAEEIRREVLAAIEHHDDGWAEWERSPRIDSGGRPVSFMELETAEALAIWSRSIEHAATHGALAGWLVAGHFMRLINKYSDATRTDAAAAQWFAQMQRQRSAWLGEWQGFDTKARTAALAEEALQWLWTFDEASLWFCCTCPAEGEGSTLAQASKRVGQGTEINMEFAARASGLAHAAPWRFSDTPILIEAAVQLIPVTRYDSPAALFAAAQPIRLRWHFAG